jgi:hypothetical protein
MADPEVEADPGARSGPNDLGVFAERLERAEALDGAVRRIERVAQRIPTRSVLPFLQGRWLGHELHPSLTDLPIGFWTSSMVLDLVGGRRSRHAADLFVALGLVTAAPTVATGLADWRRLGAARQRVAGSTPRPTSAPSRCTPPRSRPGAATTGWPVSSSVWPVPPPPPWAGTSAATWHSRRTRAHHPRRDPGHTARWTAAGAPSRAQATW